MASVRFRKMIFYGELLLDMMLVLKLTSIYGRENQEWSQLNNRRWNPSWNQRKWSSRFNHPLIMSHAIWILENTQVSTTMTNKNGWINSQRPSKKEKKKNSLSTISLTGLSQPTTFLLNRRKSKSASSCKSTKNKGLDRDTPKTPWITLILITRATLNS